MHSGYCLSYVCFFFLNILTFSKWSWSAYMLFWHQILYWQKLYIIFFFFEILTFSEEIQEKKWIDTSHLRFRWSSDRDIRMGIGSYFAFCKSFEYSKDFERVARNCRPQYLKNIRMYKVWTKLDALFRINLYIQFPTRSNFDTISWTLSAFYLFIICKMLIVFVTRKITALHRI